MTAPLSLRLANGWTVTFQPTTHGRFAITWSAIPVLGLSPVSGYMIGDSITQLLPLLREIAALEPPR